MSSPVDVSIIIINYNTREMTRDCVASIYAQTKTVRFEVIVIDNASTDGSKEFLADLPFDNYRYIYNDTNEGFSRANNRASSHAFGRYLFFMNSDMVLINDTVSFLWERMQRDAGIGIIGPRFCNPDGSLQVSCRTFPDIRAGLSRFFPFLGRFFGKEVAAYYQSERDYGVEQSVDTVSAGALMISSALFERIGRFDTFSFMYAEDADICRQVRDLGLTVVYFPLAQLTHFGGQSSRLNSYRAIWSYYLAFYHLYKKYYFKHWAFAVKPLFVLRAVLAAAGNLFKKDKRVTWNRKK